MKCNGNVIVTYTSQFGSLYQQMALHKHIGKWSLLERGNFHHFDMDHYDKETGNQLK